MNPAGYRTRVARFGVGRASHYSTKASRKGGDALVLLISLRYIVVQYEFTRWQSTYMASFTAQHTRHIMYIDYLLETFPRANNLGRDKNARIRSLRIEIDQLTRMCSQR
jgi:hypothetical protein